MFLSCSSPLWIMTQAKIDDPKTPRPDDVEFDNDAYTNPKYAGTVWYIADHLKDPTKPIIPLAALPPAKRQLDADFIDSISDALGLGNIKPRDRIRHGHRNLSTCSLTSVVAANWSGAYKYAKDITEQVGDEVKNGWVELPLPVPSTWPFRLEQQNGISQGLKENGDPKVRRATDKGHGPDSVNECIELASKLKLCTNLQIGRGAAILTTADEGPRATPNDDEDPNDPSTVADDHRTYLWKIDLTAAYRQVLIHILCLWMCHTSWDGNVYLDRRMQFGDKSAVEGFQSITNLLLCAAQAAIDGDVAMRAAVPHAAHLWQYIDARPTNGAFRRWELERLNAFGEGPQLRLNHTDGYIDDFMGSVYGRRRAYAVAAVHRAFIGEGGANFPLKASKECLPMPSMVALGGSIDTDSKLATLSDERAEKYSTQAEEVLNSTRFDSDEFHQYTSRLVSAAQYEPAGRAWLVSSFCAMRQARRRSAKKGRRTQVVVGPGVKSEARFWLQRLYRPAGIALFPRSQFPPSDDPRHRVGWFDASTSWGMGGAFLLRRGSGFVCYFFYYEWTADQQWHVNVLEAVAGLTLLVAGHRVSPAPFVSEFGDNNVANSSARRNATPNLQIAEVLHVRADFVAQELITTRQLRVSTDDNVLGDPLSRGPKYMNKFREEATKMGATSFVRMEVPEMILSMLVTLAALHPHVLQEESESREERRSKLSRPIRSPSPGAQSSSSERLCTISALGIQRTNWRYVASFAGLDTMFDVARGLGGEPACGSDNYGLARALWQQRTKRVCFSSFATYRSMLTDPEQRAHHLTRVLIYLSGPPCIDFSIAGGQRGTEGNTGQLFLDDAEGALETDAPIVISEIVLGILDEKLITFLRQKVDRLRLRYVACWRVLRCNRHGDRFTNRRRIFIVGIKAKYLRAGLCADSVDLFPPDRPADVSPGLGDIIDPSSHNDASLCFTELDRLKWLPPRELPIGYDGLRLVAKVDDSDRIGHHVYDPAGAASTIRTDGDGPGLATGLYWFDGTCRRLSFREAARTHSIPESTINEIETFVTTTIYDKSRQQKELFRLIGNSIPSLTLHDVVRHLMSLLNW